MNGRGISPVGIERCDAELLNDMFRSAHSLKGLSAMLGLTEINSLTHRVENVFDAARKDELAMGGDVVELMFQAVDRLVSLVDALRQPAAEPVECQSVIDNISAILQQAGAERRVTTQADADRALDEARAGSAPAQPAAEPRADTPPAPGSSTRAKDLTQPPAELSDPFAAIGDEQEISPKYLAIYIDEADLSLDELTETLLALEGGGSRAAVEKLLVTAHRIKGSSAALGLNRGAKLAHLMEDLLQELVELRRRPFAGPYRRDAPLDRRPAAVRRGPPPWPPGHRPLCRPRNGAGRGTLPPSAAPPLRRCRHPSRARHPQTMPWRSRPACARQSLARSRPACAATPVLWPSSRTCRWPGSRPSCSAISWLLWASSATAIRRPAASTSWKSSRSWRSDWSPSSPSARFAAR